MSVKAATINCSKELVEFSALIPQFLKFYYVILIISLPLFFYTKFSHYVFREFFTLFFSNFFAKQIVAKFREKSENFRIFRERTKCENEAKWSRKMRNFRMDLLTCI